MLRFKEKGLLGKLGLGVRLGVGIMFEFMV